MPFTLERLPNEPIIIARLSGQFPPSDAPALYAACAALADGIRGPVWLVVDLRSTETSENIFMDTLEVSRMASRALPGSPTDPRFTTVLIARDAASKLFREFMSQRRFGGVSIPIFPQMTDALLAVRLQIKMCRDQSASASAD